MDVQDARTREWSLEFDHDLSSRQAFFQEEGMSDPQPSETSRSFAKEARMRLDYLKFGPHSQVAPSVEDARILNDKNEKDPETNTVFDLVEILELKDEVEDDESWLYESPKKHIMSANPESPLKWCRRILDNPTPETEASCRLLLNKLNQKSRNPYRSAICKYPAVQSHSGGASVDPFIDERPADRKHDSSKSFGNSGRACESITTNYKLQDIADVHLMARIQEDSLRQDYITMPARVTGIKSPEPQVRLYTHF
ncbi:SLAIN motif-containing protein-like [Stigmatopora argus]